MRRFGGIDALMIAGVSFSIYGVVVERPLVAWTGTVLILLCLFGSPNDSARIE